jgi:hypothetical protein
MDEMVREALWKEARRIQEDCILTAKGHFNAASGWTALHYLLGIPATAIAALASIAAFKDQLSRAGFLSAFAAILAGLTTFLNPRANAAGHQASGVKYLTIRNDARRFAEIDLLTAREERDLGEVLKALGQQHNTLNEDSPGVPRWAFLVARSGIRGGQASYDADVVKETETGRG